MRTHFFHNKRILVLGGAGLIGSHLVDALLENGAELVVVDNLCSGRLENLNLEHPCLEFQNFDIGGRAYSAKDSGLDGLIKEADFVYHLASPIGVGIAHQQGFDTTRRILEDGLNVVDACLRHKKPVLYTSSSEIYGIGGSKALEETDTAGFGLQPRWGYGAAKMAVEHLIAGLFRDHGIPAWSVRFFNVVGPRQNPRSGLVVSAFCAAVLEGREIVVHGDGSDRRTFLHVADAAAALMAIPKSEALRGQSINVGGTENMSIQELAEKVAQVAGEGRIVNMPYEEVYGPGFVPVADRRPKLDLLMNATGWRPERTLEDAIAGCFDSMRNSVHR